MNTDNKNIEYIHLHIFPSNLKIGVIYGTSCTIVFQRKTGHIWDFQDNYLTHDNWTYVTLKYRFLTEKCVYKKIPSTVAQMEHLKSLTKNESSSGCN